MIALMAPGIDIGHDGHAPDKAAFQVISVKLSTPVPSTRAARQPHDRNATFCFCDFDDESPTVTYYYRMSGLNVGRTASVMPGIDIAEQKSWQNFLTTVLTVYAELNRQLVDAHQLSLADVEVLIMLRNSPIEGARMGDLAEALLSPPSRVTRQIRRLEDQGLVLRSPRPDDRRVVVATITDKGRTLLKQTKVTYAQGVRTHFLSSLSRPQIAAMEESCRQIATALKPSER